MEGLYLGTIDCSPRHSGTVDVIFLAPKFTSAYKAERHTLRHQPVKRQQLQKKTSINPCCSTITSYSSVQHPILPCMNHSTSFDLLNTPPQQQQHNYQAMNGNNNTQYSQSNTSSNGGHFVFGGNNQDGRQAFPSSSTQHTTLGTTNNNTTSIQVQLQQLQQYQRYNNNGNNLTSTTQAFGNPTQTYSVPNPSLIFNQQGAYNSMDQPQTNNTQDGEELIDWINEGPSKLLQQQELPHPFEDFDFGWYPQCDENGMIHNIQVSHNLPQNQYLQAQNLLTQDLVNPEIDGYGRNFTNTTSLQQPGCFVMSDEGGLVTTWNMAEVENVEIDKSGLEGMVTKNANALFGNSQLFTNHTISTTESKNLLSTSITSLANSLSFENQTQTKRGKKTQQRRVNCEHPQYEQSYNENFNVLEMDEDTFRDHVLSLFGEKVKRKTNPAPFDEDDFSKLLATKARITDLFEHCKKENLTVVNTLITQFQPYEVNPMDDVMQMMNNDMKDLYAKVQNKLDDKNLENKKKCEQVLDRLINDWIVKIKTQPVSSDKTSNNSSNSKRKQRSTNRRLPHEAKKVLENWFLDHYKHPYPTNEEKQVLSDQTQLNLTQINNWFINKRGRSLKIVKEKLKVEQTDDVKDEE